MKKSLVLLTVVLCTNSFGYTSWCQPDEEKPKQAFDYFIGGDDQICYVTLSAQAKQVLKRMLENADEKETLGNIIEKVSSKVKTEAGKEALRALQEMAEKDDQMPAGVVLDGMFGNGKKMQQQKR